MGTLEKKSKNHDCISVSIQLVSPASGDFFRNQTGNIHINGVSIQLVSPASGTKNRLIKAEFSFEDVSIQLVSPASGDFSS